MKKNFIIFSLALCAVFFGSCHKDQDNTSNIENASPTDRAADDPYASQVEPKSDSARNSEINQDSSLEKKNQGTESYAENPNSTSSAKGSALNKSSKKSKDSVTSVSGEQGAGSGVGDGGSINAAHDAQKKKAK